jgi:hypothetical protein
MFETLLENIKFFLIDYWVVLFGDGGVAVVDVQVVVRRFVYNNVFY